MTTIPLSLLLFACGGDDTGDTTDTASPDSATLTETGDTESTTDSETDSETEDTADTAEDARPSLEDLAFAALLGSREQAEAGYSVAPAGDFDGDGVLDVALGAPEDEGGGDYLGGVHVVPGPFGGVSDLDDVATFLSGAEYLDKAGVAVAGGGDLTGDGLDDLAVGLHGDRSVPILCGGRADRSSLSEACASITSIEITSFGTTMATPSDIDEDGVNDLLIGDPWSSLGDLNAGAAYLFQGPITADITSDDADAVFVNDYHYEFAALGLAGDGDVNGDGYNDVVLGAPGILHESGGAGRAFLFYGPATGTRLTADADETHDERWFGDGQDLELAADLDGDGFDDVVIGANWRFEETWPLIQVYAGATTGAGLDSGEATARIFDDDVVRSHDYQGCSLGDQDGDGDDELAVATLDAVLVFYGPLAGTLDVGDADFGLTTPVYYPLLANAGDLDEDGLDDLIVGLPSLDDLARDAGGAYLLSGVDL